MNKRLIAEAELILMTMIWGTTFALVKEAVAVIPPILFCFGRFAIGSVCLFPLIYAKAQIRDKKVWLIGCLIGVCTFLGFALQSVGLHYTTASKSGFITGLAVAFVPLVGKIFFNKKLTALNFLGLIICIAGLLLLTEIYHSFQGISINFGDMLTLIAALIFAFQILFIDRYASYDFLVIGFQECVVTAILAVSYSFMFESFKFHLDGKRMIIILFLGLVATAFTIPLQVKAQRYASAFHSILIFSLEPVFAALFAYAYSGERMTSVQIGGGVLMIIGVIAGSLDIIKKFTISRNPTDEEL